MKASCHPEKDHLAKGLCKSCYNKNYFQEHKEEYKQANSVWRLKNKKKLRNKNLLYYFGITLDQFNHILKQQNNKCAICSKENPTDLDHNHSTGKIRGILCRHCNTALGLFKENVQTIENAIGYLKIND